MERVFVILLTIVIYINIQIFQDDHFVSRLTNERLKNAINRGAHDASLQVDKEAWGQGEIKFVVPNALQTFKTTMAANIDLNPNTLLPLSKTLLSDPVEILFQDYIDANDPVTFPYVYTNSTYGINKKIYGPAVVFVVRTRQPKVHATSSNAVITKTVVFEYPFPPGPIGN